MANFWGAVLGTTFKGHAYVITSIGISVGGSAGRIGNGNRIFVPPLQLGEKRLTLTPLAVNGGGGGGNANADNRALYEAATRAFNGVSALPGLGAFSFLRVMRLSMKVSE